MIRNNNFEIPPLLGLAVALKLQMCLMQPQIGLKHLNICANLCQLDLLTIIDVLNYQSRPLFWSMCKHCRQKYIQNHLGLQKSWGLCHALRSHYLLLWMTWGAFNDFNPPQYHLPIEYQHQLKTLHKCMEHITGGLKGSPQALCRSQNEGSSTDPKF